MSVQVSDNAPDFTLQNQDGQSCRLSDQVQHGLLMLAFYPGDFTPVCTKEMVCFRNDFEQFRDLDCQIWGISTDPIDKHLEFKKEYQLPFDLLSDPDAEVSKLYGAKMPVVNKSNRAIFLVNGQMKLVYVHREVLPMFRRSNPELLEAIRQNKI